MADFAKWVGLRSLEEGKRKWTFGDRVTLVTTWTGPFENCLTERPPRGAVVAEYNVYGLVVDTTEVEELDGTAGLLTVTLMSPEVADPSVSTEAIGDPVFEVDFQEISARLESHPLCPFLDDEALAKGLSFDDWPKLCLNGTGEDDITGLSTKETSGAWTRAQYIEMKREGIEDYPKAAPIVRRTTYHFYPPSDVGEGIFSRQTPPGGSFAGIDTYEWLKGPERCTKQGRLYTRITEWWGADEWNETLYPT